MGFAIGLHLRAIRFPDREHVLILGFEGGDAYCIGEGGNLVRVETSMLQIEMHYDREADRWEDDFGVDEVDEQAAWNEAWDEQQEEADGDPSLPGPDLADQGTGDGDPSGGGAGDMDSGTGTQKGDDA